MLRFKQTQMQSLDRITRDRITADLLIEIEAAWAAVRSRWSQHFVCEECAAHRRQFFEGFMRWCDDEGVVERAEVIAGAVLLFAGAQLGWTSEVQREAIAAIGVQYGSKEAVLDWVEQEVDALAKRNPRRVS